MKRVALLLGMAAATPGVAQAQVPGGGAAPAAPVAPAPAPAPAPPPDPAPAAAPGAAPAPAPTAPAPSAAAPAGEEYYVEPPGASPAEPPPPFEPPVPGRAPYEPPPPPETAHLAPKTAFWLGARLGLFVPFGNVWSHGVPSGDSQRYYYVLQGKPWSDFASPGPMFELDLGLRLSRSYTAFALWERAQLGSGDDETGPDGAQSSAETDFWALGLRASSNPDRLGFLTEVAIGYRRARTFFDNEVEYQFTDAPFEARLGLGAEYRLSRLSTLSALATIGVGSFGDVQRVTPNGNGSPLTGNYDQGDGHAWFTLQVGGHFDLLAGSK